jgi:hypothetical protein
MKYFTTLAALLPTILAQPLVNVFRVNLITSISDLAMTSANGTVVTYNSAPDRHQHDTETLSVVGYMSFTETGVPQTYKVEFGGHTADVRTSYSYVRQRLMNVVYGGSY